ncbi:MAG: response regulator [Actinomycetota bacterium]
MAKSYDNVRLAIADPSPLVRSGLRAALNSVGFRAVSEVHTFVKLHDLLRHDAVDLVVTASEIEDNDVGFLVREMRNHRLGDNPFVVVMVLLASAEPDYVRKLVDSGVDDLLLTPVVPDQLIGRIEKIANRRKPFVVTHDYTGPDRRTKARLFTGQPAALVEVPNPIRLRMEDGPDGTRLNRQVREGIATVNRMKIERYAVQTDWLVNHIHASVRDGVAQSADLAEYMHHLVEVAEDMARRVRGTPAEAVLPTVRDIFDMAKRMHQDPAGVGFADLERLHDLAKTMGRRIGLPQSMPAAAG